MEAQTANYPQATVHHAQASTHRFSNPTKICPALASRHVLPMSPFSNTSSSLPPSRILTRPARRGGRPPADVGTGANGADADPFGGANHTAAAVAAARNAGERTEEEEDEEEEDDDDDDDDDDEDEDEDDEEENGNEDGEGFGGVEDGDMDADVDIDVDVTEEMEGGDGEGDGDGEGGIEEVPMDIDPPFDVTGLKDIGNLASWTVSTYKPGCGVEALRDDDTDLFWQSDGPQPHHLNIHFSRFVSIVSIRIFLDFAADESYTPTRITLLAGTGYHDLIPFSSLEFTQPKGWIDVPLDGAGGGPDGNTLKAFLVQVKVVENHQNGKDTHLRGLKIYARDEKHAGRMGDIAEQALRKASGRPKKGKGVMERTTTLIEPDWMGEPELR